MANRPVLSKEDSLVRFTITNQAIFAIALNRMCDKRENPLPSFLSTLVNLSLSHPPPPSPNGLPTWKHNTAALEIKQAGREKWSFWQCEQQPERSESITSAEVFFRASEAGIRPYMSGDIPGPPYVSKDLVKHSGKEETTWRQCVPSFQ